MPKLNMRYFVLKQEKEDENLFHYVVAQDEAELDSLMVTYANQMGGYWRLQKEITESTFHKLCAHNNL